MRFRRHPWSTRPTPRPSARLRRTRLRLGPWPGDPLIGHLVVADVDHVPADEEIDEVVGRAAARGLRALRTSALFPDAAVAFGRRGFTSIDSLVLLRAQISVPGDETTVHGPPIRTHPLRRRHHRAAAEVDRSAFGSRWGYDRRAIAEVRRATPVHRSRRVGGPDRIDGYAISGAGATTGYLQRLAVRPDRRRRGLASALVTDSLCWMHTRGVDAVLVNTAADNRAALALYERFGFEPMPERLTVLELSIGADRPEVRP